MSSWFVRTNDYTYGPYQPMASDLKRRENSVAWFHADRIDPFDDWHEEFNREANRTYAIMWGGYGKLSEKILQECLGAEIHGETVTFLASGTGPERILICKRCDNPFNDPRGCGGKGGRSFCSRECRELLEKERNQIAYRAKKAKALQT